MITLITGKPGMGKTSLLVSMLLKEAGERPIYVMGIPDLQIEHHKCPVVAEWTVQRQDPDDPSLMLPYYTFPPNSLIVIDEAQRVFRPRSSGSKVPDHVAAYETHRHTGVDFILITQSPKLIDANIRELVGKHIAIGQRMMGRYLWEWPYVGDIDSKTSREEAATRRFKPPKVAFDKYKSAEVHTKHSFRIHNAFYALAAVLVFIGYFGYKNYDNIIARPSSSPAQQQEAGAAARSSRAAEPATLTPHSPVAQGGSFIATPHGQVKPYSDDDFIPRNLNRPESAPVYDEIRQVQQMPLIAGCIASRSKCTCYTQQGTEIELLGEEYCRKTAENPEFNPYLSPNDQIVQSGPPNRSTAKPTPVNDPAGAI